MTISLHVRKHGPIFSPERGRAIDAFLTEGTKEVGDQGVNDVQAYLGGVLKHPTGYYRSRITTNRVGHDNRVTDSGVVYGSWLEGTSSRNRSTRFKGYTTFRRVAQRLQHKVPGIVDPLLDKYIRRLR